MGRILALISTMLLFGTASCAGVQQPMDLTGSGKAFVTQLSSGDFDSAVKLFDPTMKSASPPEKLKQAWSALTARLGAFRKQTAARQEKAGPYQFVFITCEFEKDSADIKVVYRGDGLISGMWFLPSYKSPIYANPDSFTESEIHFGSREWSLPGTLTVPKGAGPFPAIVLVHGSGPNDRNESIGPNKPFQDIAWGLATNGVAVLRYDKRTKVYAEKMAALRTAFTVNDETVDDAVAAVASLRQNPSIDPSRIYVLGHSLGGMVLPRIGARDSRIAGLVILAGSTRPLEQLMIEQLNYLISLGGAEADANKARLAKVKEQVAKLKDPHLPDTEMIVGAPPSYWRDLDSYNPGAIAASLNMPILILQGERDYQVTMDDLAGWKKALSGHPNVQVKTYPKLNHLFEEGDGKSTPAEYAKGGNVAPYVIDEIVRWLKR